MLDALKQLIGIKKKQILLCVPTYFPTLAPPFRGRDAVQVLVNVPI